MFFITDAVAQTPAPTDPMAGLMSFLPFILLIWIAYFMMIRPQMKRQKEMQAMLASLKKGDEVTTGGGLVGRISKLDDNFVTLEVSQGVELVFQRASVHSILPTGTFKP
jgi:preprotein translocase subunit YajC